MPTWQEERYRTLARVAGEAKAVPEWNDYAIYCADMECGMRQRAFVALARFLSRMEAVSFAERKRFVHWLLDRAEGATGGNVLVPHPLRKKLVEPTCIEWIEREPESSEPHRWLGFYDHLKRALELNPTDTIAARRFIICVLESVKYAIHELPAGYLGDPEEDLRVLNEAEAALPAVSDEAERTQCASEIVVIRDLIRRYLNTRMRH